MDRNMNKTQIPLLNILQSKRQFLISRKLQIQRSTKNIKNTHSPQIQQILQVIRFISSLSISKEIKHYKVSHPSPNVTFCHELVQITAVVFSHVHSHNKQKSFVHVFLPKDGIALYIGFSVYLTSLVLSYIHTNVLILASLW